MTRVTKRSYGDDDGLPDQGKNTVMAKRKQDVKPLFPVKHEFYASLDRFTHEAGMLSDAVRQCLNLPDVIKNKAARDILQERLDAFAAARFGDGEV
jgi:hypothetical protein